MNYKHEFSNKFSETYRFCSCATVTLLLYSGVEIPTLTPDTKGMFQVYFCLACQVVVQDSGGLGKGQNI